MEPKPAFIIKTTAFPSHRQSLDFGVRKFGSSQFLDKFPDETEGSMMETKNSMVLGHYQPKKNPTQMNLRYSNGGGVSRLSVSRLKPIKGPQGYMRRSIN